MEIQERVKSYEEAMLNNLATLVSYNSVQGEPQPNAPFGEIPAVNSSVILVRRSNPLSVIR